MQDALGTDLTNARSGPKTQWLLFPLFLVATLAIYYPLALHNFPVAVNVDDRTSLAVLQRFHQGSANPRFFMYPTLYYYLTYALTAPFGFSRVLFAGHLLNLSFVAVTGFISYLFCVKHFRSTGAGIIAAGCVILSPTLIWSGAYLCTDILLSAFTILSLHLLIEYFQSRSSRAWLLAMLAVGCAIATKYTAAILLITYWLAEIVTSYKERTRGAAKPDDARNSRFSKSTVSIGLISIGSVCLLSAIMLPVDSILHFVSVHRTNLDVRSDQDYLKFLNHLRRTAGEMAAGAVILFFAVRRSRVLYECISTKRLYYGALVILGVFLITTPFSILDPQQFIYDIGALLRANVVVEGQHQQWGNYWHWLFDTENKALVLFGIMGLGLMAYRATWRFFVAILYLVLYVVTICSSHLGVPRYLDPLLPLLYCGTGLMAWELWSVRPGNSVVVWRGALCLVCAAVLVQMARRTERDVKAASDHDAFYASYEEILKNQVKGTVLYAGFAPNVELNLAGYRTQAISWGSLVSGPMGGHLACDDLLLLNQRQAAENHILPDKDPSVDLLFDDSRGAGQMVMRRRGCP